ncbi:MAG TPA: hypothetical protein VIM85_04790 [Pseudomonadales bacterium]
MLVFKVLNADHSPVQKATVRVEVTDGGTATARTDRRGFVASPITGGSHGKVLVNGVKCYEGALVDLEEVIVN